jgi:hypothetical protein
MQNYFRKISQVILVLSILLIIHCNKNPQPDADEIVRVGVLYPKVLCEKIVFCIQEEMKDLSPMERKEVLPFLTNQKQCIDDQMASKVLPIDKKDPSLKDITFDRLDAVKSCIKGIEKASCNQLEDSQSIVGCKDLYDIGE